jgi:hypothetical protein
MSHATGLDRELGRRNESWVQPSVEVNQMREDTENGYYIGWIQGSQDLARPRV